MLLTTWLKAWTNCRSGKLHRVTRGRARSRATELGRFGSNQRAEVLEDRALLVGRLQILSLGTTNAQVIDHNSVTGDDRGGIATSDTHVFYTGDNQTAAIPLDLSGVVGVGTVFDALVSDLGTETVYSLGISSTTPAPNGGGTITHLLVHDGVTGGAHRGEHHACIPDRSRQRRGDLRRSGWGGRVE